MIPGKPFFKHHLKLELSFNDRFDNKINRLFEVVLECVRVSVMINTTLFTSSKLKRKALKIFNSSYKTFREWRRVMVVPEAQFNKTIRVRSYVTGAFKAYFLKNENRNPLETV